MAYAGQTLDNPVSGERITFRRTSADTNGELLEFDLTLAPDGHVPGAHIHPEQEERFFVHSGRMQFRLGFRKIIAEAGDSVIVPAGRVHKFRNGGDVEAQVRVQVAPALDMEELFETTVELAQEGNTNRKGMPKPLHLALFVRRFRPRGARPVPAAGGRPPADGAARLRRAQARLRQALRGRACKRRAAASSTARPVARLRTRDYRPRKWRFWNGPLTMPGLDVLGPARTLGPVIGDRGVEAKPRDHDHRVAGVRVDGDPAALAALAPASEGTASRAGCQGGRHHQGRARRRRRPSSRSNATRTRLWPPPVQ